jgi:cytochrome c553
LIGRMNLRNIWQLSGWIVTGLLAPLTSLAQVDEARVIKIISGSCFICHGTKGELATELVPKLAGQNADYIARQLANFKNGTRVNKEMSEMASKLTPAEMLALGKYFEKQN